VYYVNFECYSHEEALAIAYVYLTHVQLFILGMPHQYTAFNFGQNYENSMFYIGVPHCTEEVTVIF